jgi:DNA-binding MarR family transcriptional regulator
MQAPPPPEEPIALLIAAVRRGVRELVAVRLAPHGLSSQQFWVLVGIAEHPCHSQAELAARLRIDEAIACRVIRALLGRGLVAALRDAEDRRRVQLGLTAEGKRLARALLPIATEVRAAVDAPLTAAERAITRAALRKIVAGLTLRAADAPAPRARRARPKPRAARRAEP